MRDLIKHIQEADVFKPASEEEVKNRHENAKAEADAERKRIVAKLGRNIDICPKCNADLRKEGVIAFETSWSTVPMSYSERDTSWYFGDSEVNDSEITEYECPACNASLRSGRDFDVTDV